MSFYTHNRPRLIEPSVYNKLIQRNIPIVEVKSEPLIDYNKYLNSITDFLKKNWSFLFILGILISILYYRYNIIKKDQEMKKARKQYIDQIIMNNYKKEKEKEIQKQQNNNFEPQPEEIENEELVEETFDDLFTTDNNPPQILNGSAFDRVFQSKLDKKFEPYYGNSSFAHFEFYPQF